MPFEPTSPFLDWLLLQNPSKNGIKLVIFSILVNLSDKLNRLCLFDSIQIHGLNICSRIEE
jgi:hypothetical protein